MDFLLDDLDTDGALREAGENAGISRATFLGGTVAGTVAAFAITPTAEAATNHDVDVLNFALMLEYLQSSFYTEAERAGRCAGRPRTPPARRRGGTRAREGVQGAAGPQAVKRPAFNFRGVTEAERPFLKTAVAFEDLAVAAYKGQAPRIRAKPMLAAAVAIHSVEARHAAWMRFLFGVQPAVNAFDDASDKAEVERIVAGTNFVVARPRTTPVGGRASPGDPARSVPRDCVVAACAVAGLAWLLLGGEGQAAPRRRSLPASPRPALTVPAPSRLGVGARGGLDERAAASTARARPRRGARPLAGSRRRTPEGTANVVLVTGRASDARRRCGSGCDSRCCPTARPAGCRAGARRLPDRPHAPHRRPPPPPPRSARRAQGIPRGRRRRPSAVAHAARALLHPQPTDPLPQPHLRPARLRHERPVTRLTDWPAGGFIGIHGTDRPGLLPGRVSHGCIRMRNRDIVRLGRLMGVGTPLTIR